MQFFCCNGFLPIYSKILSLDNVNFSYSTVWEGVLSVENPFIFENKHGKQIISEGSSLKQIKDETYEFILSCNNLEHLANPILAILEWKRILTKDGILLIILPNKKANFDHKRKKTSIEHLIEDYINKIYKKMI